jgi:hypothetical protein
MTSLAFGFDVLPPAVSAAAGSGSQNAFNLTLSFKTGRRPQLMLSR